MWRAPYLPSVKFVSQQTEDGTVHLPNESQPCKTLRFFTLAKDLRWGYSGNLGPALSSPPAAQGPHSQNSPVQGP